MKTGAQVIVVLTVMQFCRPVLSAEAANAKGFTATLRTNIALFDSAYNAWNDTLFLETYHRFATMARRYPDNHLPLYWQGVVQFYRVTYALFGLPEERNRAAAKTSLKTALNALNAALEKQPGNGESLALLGTLTGINIYLNPLKAPMLGPKVMSSIKAAIAADSTNPRIYYLVGVSYYNTPALVGGGWEKTLEYLTRAERLYEKEAALPRRPRLPHWGRSTCLGFIAETYVKNKEYDKARTYFKKALAVNPADKMALTGLRKLKRTQQ